MRDHLRLAAIIAALILIGATVWWLLTPQKLPQTPAQEAEAPPIQQEREVSPESPKPEPRAATPDPEPNPDPVMTNETVAQSFAREKTNNVTGRVTALDGSPIPFASIYEGTIVPADNDNRAPLAMGDDLGHFKIPAGKLNRNFTAIRDGYNLEQGTFKELQDTDGVIQIVMTRGGVIDGYLTYAGDPVGGQPVITRIQDTDQEYSTRTDETGRYIVDALPSGLVTLRADVPYEGGVVVSELIAEVAEGQITYVDLPLGEGTAGVGGSVLVDGQPAAGAEVIGRVFLADSHWEGFHVRVNNGGRYESPLLPAAEIELVARVTGPDNETIEGEAYVDLVPNQTLQQDLQFRLTPYIDGQITGMNDNDQAIIILIPGRVQIPEPGPELFEAGALNEIERLTTTEDTFTIDNLEPGAYTVVAIAIPISADPTEGFSIGAQTVNVTKAGASVDIYFQ